MRSKTIYFKNDRNLYNFNDFISNRNSPDERLDTNCHCNLYIEVSPSVAVGEFCKRLQTAPSWAEIFKKFKMDVSL